MRQYAVEIFSALVDYRGKADYLGARADDYQQFQFSVIFEFYVFIIGFHDYLVKPFQNKYRDGSDRIFR